MTNILPEILSDMRNQIADLNISGSISIECADGTRAVLVGKDGKIHAEDGPAQVIWRPDGSVEMKWFRDGEEVEPPADWDGRPPAEGVGRFLGPNAREISNTTYLLHGPAQAGPSRPGKPSLWRRLVLWWEAEHIPLLYDKEDGCGYKVEAFNPLSGKYRVRTSRFGYVTGLTDMTVEGFEKVRARSEIVTMRR